MPQPEHLDPTSYAAGDGPTGALIIHGFGGSAAETRPMGQYLAERGLTVRCPLLAGHGTTAGALRGVRWQSWVEQVDGALRELQAQCEAVFVCGLSMGSLLALWLGEGHQEIAGLVLMAPAVRLKSRLLWLTAGLRYVIRYPPSGLVEQAALGDPEAIYRSWYYDKVALWGAGELYFLQRRVRKSLGVIQSPLLIFQGRLDNLVSPDSGQILCDSVASVHTQLVWLEHSGHNLLVDGERETVWAQSYDWMRSIASNTA